MNHTSRTPRPSNLLTYLLVLLFVLGGMAFLYLLFGELFVIAVAAFGAIGLMACFHYLLWGRSLTEQAKKEAKAELERGE